MYTPNLREDQIRAMYLLARRWRKPMTHVLRQAVEAFLKLHAGEVECAREDMARVRPRRTQRGEKR